MDKKPQSKQKLDEQETKIIKALIRNPRMSDNKIAKLTGIPVMTVNRKRKKLEESEIISYFADVKRDEEGIGRFTAHQLYILKFKPNLTIEKFSHILENDTELRAMAARCVDSMYIGERDGYPTLICILETRTNKGLINFFNSKLVPALIRLLGEDSIIEIITSKINYKVRLLHNYVPSVNMEKGRIKKEWPDELIFVE